MGGLLFSHEPSGLWSFLIFTVALGGLGAWATGRAFASTWRSPWMLIPALVVLAMAVRFLHYASGGEDLLSIQYYVVALIVGALLGAFGFRSQRAQQMARQYSWLFRRAGPMGWSVK